MGFINDLANGLGGLLNGGSQALFGGGGDNGAVGLFAPYGPTPSPLFSPPQPMQVTTNQDPVGQTSGYGPMPFVDPYAVPFMPGLGQYTRDPSSAYHVRGNEFPGSAAAPKPADATHAPYIPDPPKPVWTPWHQAIATGGWGAGPLGAGMGIPGAPDGTPFMTKTWTQPQTPRPPSAPTPFAAPAPAAPAAPQAPQNSMGWSQASTAAASAPGNANTAWSGGNSPSWRR